MLSTIVNTEAKIYKNILRPLIFKFNSEQVHESFTDLGTFIGSVGLVKNVLEGIHQYKDSSLVQKLHGVTFENPVGLAAGFDYHAKLTQVLPSIGFGFGTVGTITNMAYEGNPKPLLGRLPKSQSLMVNKGFKNEGIDEVLKKLKKQSFIIPIGLSVGRTNTAKFKNLGEAIDDIKQTYKKAEKSKMDFSYYELNISCPNLVGNIDFYSLTNLNKLLKAVCSLKLSKPLFVKMPINKTDKEIRDMLLLIQKYPIAGVIFGNLQKDRKDPSLVQSEVSKFSVGNFSGKPTQKRSDDLIKLAYKTTKGKLTIIGCGGIFSAEDAYRKIKNGASLVQLITGMIFEGPQLPSQVAFGLAKLLKQDGYSHLSEAVGANVK